MNVSSRVEALRKEMEAQGMGLALVMGHENMFYFTNYKAIIYSRPIMVAIDGEDCSVIVPGLEEDHAKAHADADCIYVYYEHPEKVDQGKTPFEFQRLCRRNYHSSASHAGFMQVQRMCFLHSVNHKLRTG